MGENIVRLGMQNKNYMNNNIMMIQTPPILSLSLVSLHKKGGKNVFDETKK